MKLLDLQVQYQAYKEEIDKAINTVITSGHFIGGPMISGLEEALSSYCDGGVSTQSIVCSSGTDALLLALMALDLGPGDEVITTPYSFIATAEVIGLLRAKTVFVDVDPHTFNIDNSLIAAKITEHTKAVIPVSLFGEIPDMPSITETCHKKNIPIIEDAAQSFGALSPQGRSGSLSILAATSFFPAKPLGCYGDGGAVFTQDNKIGEKIRMLLNHGQSQQYYHDHIGINGRLDALQAAVISVKLKYLDKELEARNRIADHYRQHINPDYFIPQKVNPENRSTYAQYCLTLNSLQEGEALSKSRQEVRDYLNKRGIPTAVYYPVPIHLQKPFLKLGYQQGDFPVSERLSQSMFALPVHPFLSEAEITEVVDQVNAAGKAILNR